MKIKSYSNRLTLYQRIYRNFTLKTMKPYIPVLFGAFGYFPCCTLWTNLWGEVYAIPSRNLGYLLYPDLVYGILFSGVALGLCTTLALKLKREHRLTGSRIVAICTGTGECALLLALWVRDGKGLVDGMTAFALVPPLGWCVTLVGWIMFVKGSQPQISLNIPPIAKPK